MIGRDFSGFDAMVFPECSGIHMLFMTRCIDAVFIDKQNTVTKICEYLPAWHPGVFSFKAVTVIELPAGAVGKSGTRCGDRLELNMIPEQNKDEQNANISKMQRENAFSAESSCKTCLGGNY